MEKDNEKRKAEEAATEEKRKQAEEEKRQEARKKELDILKRADARNQGRSKAGASPTRKKPTAEELKRK